MWSDRAVVVGLGNMGRRRAEILHSNGVEVVGVDKEALHARYPTRVDSLSALDIEGVPVYVCTPPESHVSLCTEALALGASRVFVEKPLSTTWVDAATLSLNPKVRVGANWLLAPTYQEARRWATKADEISLLAMANVSRWPKATYEREFLLESGPHMLAILEFLSNSTILVCRIEVFEDCFILRWEFENAQTFTGGFYYNYERDWVRLQLARPYGLREYVFPTEDEGPLTILKETLLFQAGYDVGLSAAEACRHLWLLAGGAEDD